MVNRLFSRVEIMKKILLIIANNVLLQRVTNFLTEEQYEVFNCQNAVRSVESTMQVEPDLIICEADMPVISGMQLPRLFKRHRRLREIPFLLVTTKMPSLREMRRSGFRVEADDILQLPISKNTLLSYVSAWLQADQRPVSISERISGYLDTLIKASPGKIWKKGRINRVSAGKLLYHLVLFKETGTLNLQLDDHRMTVYIEDGQVIDIDSSYLRKDSFGAHLVSQRKITEKENLHYFLLAQKSRCPLGQMLLDADIFELPELKSHLAQHKKKKLLGLFKDYWQDAAFEFIPEGLPEIEPGIEPMPINKLLQEAVFSQIDDQVIIKAFDRNDKLDQPLTLNERFDKVIPLFNLEAAQVAKFREIEANSINDLRTAYPDSFSEYLQMAFFLIVTRSAGFGGSQSQPGARRSVETEDRQDNIIPDSGPTRFHSWDADGYNQSLSEARTMLKQEQYRTVKMLVAKALDMNPESSEAMTMLAWANYKLAGEDDRDVRTESKEMLKKAFSLDDSNDKAMTYLGNILKSEGKESLANSYYHRAHAINATNEEAMREVVLSKIKRRERTKYRK